MAKIGLLCPLSQNINFPSSTKTSLYREPEPLLIGNIHELRKSMIKGFVNEKVKLRVEGRLSGEVIMQQT